MRLSHLPRIAIRLFLLFTLAGCALHAPQEATLPAPLPQGYAEQAGAPATAPPIGRWWENFGNQRLNTLVEEAFAANLDLEQALARLQQAEAGIRTARAARRPTLNLEGSGGRSRQVSPFFSLTDDSYRLSAAAAYELDLWSKLSSREAATRLDALAGREAVETAYLSLSARVADLYFLAVEQRAQLELADRSIAAFADTLERVERRYREGLVPALDLYQSRQNLASAQSRRPQFENGLAASEHALAVLLGRFPHRQGDGELAALPPAPAATSTGLPSQLLMRRPDIEGALLRLRGSDERIASAIADRFPSFTLTGSYGSSSPELGDLFASGNIFWSLLVNLSQPILDGGRRSAEVERTRAVFRENLALYHQAVLTAFREVEDALVANRTSEERIARLEERTEASRAALRLALDRYLQGLSDYLPVLTAQGQQFDAESQLLAAKRQLFSDRITLARSLGGEWMEQEMKNRENLASR